MGLKAFDCVPGIRHLAWGPCHANSAQRQHATHTAGFCPAPSHPTFSHLPHPNLHNWRTTYIQDGKRDGVGVKMYADGSTFHGIWRDGMKNGVGVFKPAAKESKARQLIKTSSGRLMGVAGGLTSAGSGQIEGDSALNLKAYESTQTTSQQPETPMQAGARLGGMGLGGAWRSVAWQSRAERSVAGVVILGVGVCGTVGFPTGKWRGCAACWSYACVRSCVKACVAREWAVGRAGATCAVRGWMHMRGQGTYALDQVDR